MTDAYAINRTRKMLDRIERFELPDCIRGSIAWNCWRRDMRAVEHLVRRHDALVTLAQDLAEGDCSYGDGCPAFGTRHGQCTACKAREALSVNATFSNLPRKGE